MVRCRRRLELLASGTHCANQAGGADRFGQQPGQSWRHRLRSHFRSRAIRRRARPNTMIALDVAGFAADKMVMGQKSRGAVAECHSQQSGLSDQGRRPRSTARRRRSTIASSRQQRRRSAPANHARRGRARTLSASSTGACADTVRCRSRSPARFATTRMSASDRRRSDAREDRQSAAGLDQAARQSQRAQLRAGQPRQGHALRRYRDRRLRRECARHDRTRFLERTSSPRIFRSLPCPTATRPR